MGSMKLLDTNILIYQVSGFLDQPLVGADYEVSIITEIEVMGHPGLTAQTESDLKLLLQTMRIVPIDEAIKNEAIRLRRTTTLRLPDAIIAATAIVTGSELLTHDAGLLKLPGLKVSAPPLKP
jgi:predicted nucleic acid-binding protein